MNLAGLNEIEFQTKGELESWLANQLATWSWLWDDQWLTGSLDRDAFRPIRNTFTQVTRKVVSLDPNMPVQAQNELQNLDGPLRSLFAGRGQNTLFASDSVVGRRILLIRKRLGSDAARWHLMLASRQKNINSVAGTEDLSLIVGGLVYDEAWAGDVGATLKQERANYRAAITKLENRVRELEVERREDRSRLSSAMRKQANRQLSRYRKLWANGESSITQKVDASLQSIASTEDKYRTQMGLRAPVEYWRAKAKTMVDGKLRMQRSHLVFLGSLPSRF